MRLPGISLLLALVVIPFSVQSADAPDTQRIRTLLSSTFDKPGSKVVAEPVVVNGSHAIASWTQGETGGRALLRKDKGKWVLVACSGDGLKEADTLETAGIERGAAKALAKQLAVAESKVPAERRKRFSLFGPTLDTSVAHPPQDVHKH